MTQYDVTYYDPWGTQHDVKIKGVQKLNRSLDTLQKEGNHGFIILNEKTGEVREYE